MFSAAEITHERTAARREGFVTNEHVRHIAELIDSGGDSGPCLVGPYSAERVRMLAEQYGYLLHDSMRRSVELTNTRAELARTASQLEEVLHRVNVTAKRPVFGGDADLDDDGGFDPYAPGAFDDPDADDDYADDDEDDYLDDDEDDDDLLDDENDFDDEPSFPDDFSTDDADEEDEAPAGFSVGRFTFLFVDDLTADQRVGPAMAFAARLQPAVHN